MLGVEIDGWVDGVSDARGDGDGGGGDAIDGRVDGVDGEEVGVDGFG